MAIYAYITVADITALRPNSDGRIAAFVTSANALAIMAAPGIASPEFIANEVAMEALRAILRSAVIRWDDMANGATNISSHTYQAGPLSETQTTDNRQRGGFYLWPSEEALIRGLLGPSGSGRAFTIATAPLYGAANHSPSCSVYFGASWCDCGAYLTGYEYPLYGVGDDD